ncbi:glycosyltransferase [Mycobacterium adipatum]|uniref:glycosyltransferase n=1 Tax=Mycobacterium adipatum TaxID=1682113 RepID=UPI0034E0670B
MLSLEALLWTITALSTLMLLYPYLIYPLILSILPHVKVETRSSTPSTGGSFALLFCAYNEAKALPAKIGNLRALTTAYPELEVLVYDDCSSDGTADLLEAACPNIQVVRGTHRAGKAHGMKLLAALTKREFLVFTDANVELDIEVLTRLQECYADSAVGGVCGLLEYLNPDGTPTAEVGNWYWRLEEAIKTSESRTGNVMGADGSIFSIRRAYYPKFDDSVLDDLTVSMSVIFQGKRLIKEPTVIAREHLVASNTEDFRRRIRIATRAFHTHMTLRPQLRGMPLGDRWRYWSHRYLRWHGAIFILTGGAAGATALALTTSWFTAVVAVATIAAVMLTATKIRLGPVSAVVHLVWSVLLTGIGVLRARRGGTMTIWVPPAR